MTRDRDCINEPHFHRYLALATAIWLPIMGFLAYSLTWLSPLSNNWIAALVTLVLNLAAALVAGYAFLRYQWSVCLSEDHFRLRRWSDYAVSRPGVLVAHSELRGISAYESRSVRFEFASGQLINIGTLLWRSNDFDRLETYSERSGHKMKQLSRFDRC
jgi:hypothetical protein